MFDKAAALAVAQAFIERPEFRRAIEVVIVRERTIERPFGWVFFYNAKSFVEHGNHGDALIGNAPLIVDRRDGSIHLTGTGRPIQFYIEKYEREHPFNQPAGLSPPVTVAGTAASLALVTHATSAAVASAATAPSVPTPIAPASSTPAVTTQAAPQVPARRGTRRLVVLIFAVAILTIAAIGVFGWHKLRPSAVDSVPVLAQYAPADPHAIIAAVSLSSSMSQDFDPARVGTKFSFGVPSAVLWYRWGNATPGQLLQIVWSKDGNEVLRQRLPIATPSGEQAFALRLPDGAPLPAGQYQVALLEADKPVTSIPFQIER